MEKRPPEVLRNVRNLVLTVIGFWVAVAIAAALIFGGAKVTFALLRMGAAAVIAIALYRAHRAFVAWWDGTGKDFRG